MALPETPPRPRILCVDDEPQVLAGLALHLRRHYDVVTAPGGQAGLEQLRSLHGGFSVVISDMRMPGMDGAAFLRAVRELAPETTRLLLTGQTDMASAISAVNEGQIFRFLAKPCAPPDLQAAVEAAVEQHRLLTAERVLLEQTLRGSIKMLTDVLALTSPLAFGRATRVKTKAVELARRAGLQVSWAFEVAAMLVELGSIVLPPALLEKLHFGQELSAEEASMAAQARGTAQKLLASIPRLELVRAILALCGGAAVPAGLSLSIADRVLADRAAAVLRLVLDYDALEAQGSTPAVALDILRGRVGRHDPVLLEALAGLCSGAAEARQAMELPVGALQVGMVLVEDLLMASGAMLAPRGYEVSTGLIERLRNLPAGAVKGKLRVYARP